MESWLSWRLREAVSGKAKSDHMEARVLGAGIRQEREDLGHLKERARP
jgi:hypothetical protein